MKYEKVLKISREEAERLQLLLDREDIDFREECIAEDSTEAVFTVTFDDGKQADIKVCSGQTNFFIDPVLFDENGSEICTNDTCETLLSSFSFTSEQDEYVVTIEIEELTDREIRAHELAKKLQDLMEEISKEFKIMVCEKDDADAISTPVSVEYDKVDKRIYINSTYQ